MATYQNQNQFKPTQLLGQQDLTVNNNIITCRIYASSVATVLTAGQAMKLVDQAGGVPVVDVAAITDLPFGVIVHNTRKDTYVAGDYVDVAAEGSYIYLETSAAIARDASVQNAVAGPLIATQTSTNSTLGIAVDKATAANQLIRIKIAPKLNA